MPIKKITKAKSKASRKLSESIREAHEFYGVTEARAKAKAKTQSKANRKFRDILIEVHGTRGINGPWANPKAQSKEAAPKANPIPQTGVDAIVAYLVKHKDRIGAIVVGVAAYPGERIPSTLNGAESSYMLFGADGTAFDRHESINRRSLITQGLVVSLANRHIDSRQSMMH